MTMTVLHSKGRPRVSPFLLFFLFACAACTEKNPDRAPAASPAPSQNTSLPASRIVSLAPSITETLFALGLDSSVVGVTDFCDEPPQVRGRARVGGMISPSFETIVSLKPDLILMTIAGNSRADHDKLVSLGFQVVVTNPSSIEGIYESIALIGSLTGSRTRADSIISQLRSKQRELVSWARTRPARSVLLLVSLRPIIAAGSGTFLHELIGLANGRNVAARAPSAYPMLGREYILERDPDVIVVMNDVASSPRDVVEAYPEWKNLTAVHRNSLHILDASVVSRPGPRIMNGLELLVSSLN